MFWLRKMLSPSGILLILICLFFPFVGVACGPFEAEISGWDMAVGGKASISPPVSEDEADTDIPVQPLMIVFVLALLVAMTLGLALRSAVPAALGGAIAMGFAALSLVANQLVVMADLTGEIAADSASEGIRLDAADVVGSRFGFWLTLVLVVALLGYNIVELARNRRRNTAPAWPASYYEGGPPWAPPWHADRPDHREELH